MARSKVYVYQICWGIILLLIFPCFVSSYTQLSSAQEKEILQRMWIDVEMNPFYLFGGSSIKPGAPKDCSGIGAAHWNAVGALGLGENQVTRTVAGCMSEGRDGWDFPEISFDRIKPLAMIFTTPKRRCGKYCARHINGHAVKRKYPCERTHVQYALSSCEYGKVVRVLHASLKYGLMAITIRKSEKDYWHPKIDTIRQVDWN